MVALLLGAFTVAVSPPCDPGDTFIPLSVISDVTYAVPVVLFG